MAAGRVISSVLMLEQRIQQQFFESADLLAHSADPLSRSIAQAAQAMLGAITGGGKVLFAGAGPASALAAYGASLLIGRFERDRPPLAALPLHGDVESRALEVQALGAPGDVMVALGAGAQAASLLPVVRAAQSKDMIVIALTGADAGGIGAALAETDVLIAVPHDRAARLHEVQLLVLHCLADALDLQLMGEQDSP
jgi:D-sedoheptulose 7-phosphate isomerase